jgi:hypothetical protein
MSRLSVTVRPRRVVAIAKRDLLHEFRGRHGLVLPALTGLLLLPIASIEVPFDPFAERERVRVTGQVPAEVLELENVDFVRWGAFNRFRPDVDGALLVEGAEIDLAIREALDGEKPAITMVDMSTTPKVPSRSIFFAMISASILTGAIAESIPGERSRKTLKTLLAASISRLELILGKWAAWSLFGGGSALFAAMVAIGLGRQEAGLWLLPLPTVAMATVAVGLFLVHRAEDVVSGATVSLRILPAVLTCSGLLAWIIGNENPIWGALIPIGGALVAAGNTWTGVGPPVIATLSSLGLTAGLLLYTAGHLEQLLPIEQPLLRRFALSVLTCLLTTFCWWTPVVGPLLWASGGNPQLTRDLATEPGIYAGAMGLGLLVLLYAGRSRDLSGDFLLKMPEGRDWVAGLVAGLLLALCSPAGGLMPLPEHPLFSGAALRMAAGLNPAWCGLPIFAFVVVAQELLYRGWLQTKVGPVLAAVLYAGVMLPLNPLRGLPAAALLAALTLRTSSVFPAIVARFVWGYAAIAMAPIGTWAALAISIAAPVLLLGLPRGDRESA